MFHILVSWLFHPERPKATGSGGGKQSQVARNHRRLLLQRKESRAQVFMQTWFRRCSTTHSRPCDVCWAWEAAGRGASKEACNLGTLRRTRENRWTKIWCYPPKRQKSRSSSCVRTFAVGTTLLAEHETSNCRISKCDRYISGISWSVIDVLLGICQTTSLTTTDPTHTCTRLSFTSRIIESHFVLSCLFIIDDIPCSKGNWLIYYQETFLIGYIKSRGVHIACKPLLAIMMTINAPRRSS